MHVDDIAEGLIAAALSREEGAMNVASGRSVALGDLARMLARAMGQNELLGVGTVPAGPGNPEEIYADTERLSRIYQAEGRSFMEGISGLLS